MSKLWKGAKIVLLSMALGSLLSGSAIVKHGLSRIARAMQKKHLDLTRHSVRSQWQSFRQEC
jgi:hypothetical protein